MIGTLQDPLMWGVDMGQLEQLERLARDKLATLGFADPDLPLPAAADLQPKLFWMCFWECQSVRDHIAAHRLEAAGQCMSRARQRADEACRLDEQAQASIGRQIKRGGVKGAEVVHGKPGTKAAKYRTEYLQRRADHPDEGRKASRKFVAARNELSPINGYKTIERATKGL